MIRRTSRPLALCTLLLAGSPAAAQEVRFPMDEVTLRAGRTQVVAFEVAEAADEWRTLAVEARAPEVLAARSAAEVGPERTLGFVRLEGLRPGTCELVVGGSPLTVRVVEPEPARQAPVRRPGIESITPVSGAYVWGTFSIGVELHGTFREAPEAWLALADGTRIEPVRRAETGGGRTWRLRFDVDADTHPEGPLVFRPHARLANGEVIEGAPRHVVVVQAAPDALLSGECEDLLEAERPAAFGADLPRLGSSPDASNDLFVLHETPDPAWVFHVDVERPALYQLIVTTRGDEGAGALPSIGVAVDSPGDQRNGCRLADRLWHRLPVGRPFQLWQGPHALSPRFLNERNLGGGEDRNLYLDRFELLRLDAPASLANIGSTRMGAMTMAGMSMAAPAAMDPATAPAEPPAAEASAGNLWIGLEHPLDGLPIHGRLQIQGLCRWDGMGSTPAPQVELHLNGERVARQQATQPLFALDRSAFEDGENTLQLVAHLPDGRRGETPVQTVHVHSPDGRPARDLHRFSAVDERWVEGYRHHSDVDQERGHVIFGFTDAGELALELPEDLVGAFTLMLEARGPESPRTVPVKLALDGAALGEVEVQGWWGYRPLTENVVLGPGAKTLTLQVPSDDLTREGKPYLQLRAVMLRSVREPDRHPPRARVLYPAPGAEVHGVDAVVVEAWDDDRLDTADLLLDGRPMRSPCPKPAGAGYLVFPLLLRDVRPGPHRLSVRVRDEAGNLGESLELDIVVREAPPESPGRYARAVHLLNRFGYGVEPQELARVLLRGERVWLEDALAGRGTGDATALGYALADKSDNYRYHVIRAALLHGLLSDNPVRVRFAFWVDNHFSTWINKSQGQAEWHEHRQWIELGPAPFGELLLTSATSPAMLYYLDQFESYARRLNENLAREVMELHSLGVDGGYTQAEVTELASLLAGLTLSHEARADGGAQPLEREFRYAPDLSDSRPRELLGVRFGSTAAADRFDRLEHVLEVLAAHPSTARFLCNKLAEHYVSVPADPRLVADLERTFLRTGGDLQAVLLDIAEHDAFWRAMDTPRFTSPLDYGLRLCRVIGHRQTHWALAQFLDRSGMAPFDRATPDGYPEEEAAWADTNAMIQRWAFPGDIQWGVRLLVPDALRSSAGGDVEGWYQRVVDTAAARLTGHVLGEESNAAALEFLQGEEGQAWQLADRATVLLCQLPEASLK